jgi:Preprotein translocase subunit SecA (ATPase, RNA helicase)
LKKLGLKDGESIDHPWINKAIERAQQKVEARNFEIRKTLIKFDDVLNDQRHVIFSQRNEVIKSENIFEYSNNFLNELIDRMLLSKKTLSNYTSNISPIKKYKVLFGKGLEPNNMENLLNKDDKDIKKILNKKFSEQRKNRIDYLGEDRAKDLEKRIFLQSIDFNWKSHIQYLEQLRGVVGLRSYGQKDPLIEYKKEAFDLFENLLEKLKFDLISILLNLKIVEKENEEEKENNFLKSPKINPKYVNKKMSRNEPCFCGSGKKYKRCCGAL